MKLPFSSLFRIRPMAVFWGASVGAACTLHAASETKGKIDFAREIRPILSNYCFHCHGPDEKNRKGGDKVGLRLDEEAGALRDLGGYAAVVPQHPEKSAILQRIETKDEDEVMPPPKSGKKVTPKELELLKRWIAQGAQYAPHWAYSVPRRTEPPQGEGSWGRHPIDRFLHPRLVQEGLKPNPPADKPTLVRRVMLDLTGLPATPEEVDAFVKDGAPDAYAKMVDRALAKPSFGEHWARMWMDLARYADSAGYPSDPGRSIWAYRDYVIRSFNANKPFDQFTVEQLAGDLLPNPTEEQIIATAFHRNTMTNNEGGTVDEEFRNAAVIDRVNTTWSVWMGTSMACAQCHTHKFDPLTQKEYFQFFAIFNQTEDADRRDEAPLHEFYLPEEATRKSALEGKIRSLEEQFKNPAPAWVQGFEGWNQGFAKPLSWERSSGNAVRVGDGAVVEPRADGSFLVQETEGKRGERFQVNLPLGGRQLTALQLATVPDEKLSGKGASAGSNGAFTVERIEAAVLPKGRAGVAARFVRVELTGATRPLQVAELEVISGGKNVAMGATATLSATQGEAVAARAVDGNAKGKESVAITPGQKAGDFLEVDLGTVQWVEKVRVTAPQEGGYYLGDFKVTLLDGASKPQWVRMESNYREAVKEWEPLGGQELKFRAVYASSVAPGSEPQTAVGLKPRNGGAVKVPGWSVAATSKAQQLTLILNKPVALEPGDELRVEIVQGSVKKEQRLASFALATTGDERAEAVAALPQNVLVLAGRPLTELAPAQKEQLRDFYVRKVAPEAEAERTALSAAKTELEALKPDTVPVMRELKGDKLRTTKVQIRGNYLVLGEEVGPGTPAIFPQPPKSSEGSAGKVDRLAAARWLVSPENPLTARVTVNRFWEAIFGAGIVRTSEEFGAQGEMPVHPDLLDWLATELVRTQWNVKELLKLLVTSEAYQQSSAVSEQAREKDPENRLVSRGPRFRTTGEVLRDQALFVSGLLSEKMYGKPVRPPKPESGLSNAFGGSNDWVTSTGEDRYRRALYTEVKRSSPYPSFSTFDAPNREVCTIRRNRTNTPLQAFVTLNDPVFVECAQGLARRIVREGGDSIEGRVQYAYRCALSRAPSAAESARVQKLYAELLAGFQAEPERAKAMATVPLGAPPAAVPVPELAAWTAVSNVLLNLDEFLMRR